MNGSPKWVIQYRLDEAFCLGNSKIVHSKERFSELGLSIKNRSYICMFLQTIYLLLWDKVKYTALGNQSPEKSAQNCESKNAGEQLKVIYQTMELAYIVVNTATHLTCNFPMQDWVNEKQPSLPPILNVHESFNLFGLTVDKIWQRRLAGPRIQSFPQVNNSVHANLSHR
jgi:hypothetical protein